MNENDIAKDNRWLLPEGVDEVLPPRAALLEQRRRELLDLFAAWGYELVIPPFIEFLDSLLTGAGRDLDLATFKLTDQLSGRLMGVRADMTPQAARIEAHQLKRDEPVRLCYLGTVLKTRPEGMGRSRDPLQVGAELFGHAGIESDVEIISLMLESVRTIGIDALHLDLGHVGIFRALAAQAGLDADTESRLFDALQRKARGEIMALLESLPIHAELREMLASLPALNGGVECLAEARQRLARASADVLAALGELEAIAQALREREPALPLHFDLAELRGYQYQTGVVFAAFAPGFGQELARGGRYDEIGKVFGRSRPATGFSADLKTLAALSARGAEPATGGVFAPWGNEAALLEAVRGLRASGERVVQALPGQAGDARAMGCDRELRQGPDGAWQAVAL